MEMCITWEISTLDLEDHLTEATLCQLIMNIPSPTNPASHLFHSVNKMFNQKGIIFWFHQPAVKTHETLLPECVFTLKTFGREW